MKISSTKYPMDIIICFACSIILLPLVLMEIQDSLRIIFGIPFFLFIPGYILIFTLFPTKNTIDKTERLALSIGLSIAIVPLIGLGLNYTIFGIRLEPMFFSIIIFIIGIGLIGIYRWFKTPLDQRFIVNIEISFPTTENKLDKVLTIILAAVIIISVALLLYVIATPKIGERFTEIYLLGPEGNAKGYQYNLTTGENASVIIGLVNHEYKTMNYTIETWLVNQTTTMENNETIFHNMWFMDKINVTLNYTSIDVEERWRPQWEYNYTFNIKYCGLFKLVFLLYTEPTDNYTHDIDYKDIAEQKISFTNNSAYGMLHLWIKIQPEIQQ